jgi:hypothetical protein
MVLEGRNNLDIDKWSMTSDLVVNKFDNALTLALSSPCLCCRQCYVMCLFIYLTMVWICTPIELFIYLPTW